MNRILYEARCRCKEKRLIAKKKRKSRRGPRLLVYPESSKSKMFRIKYQKKLSTIAKLIFYSFKNKYLYHAIDDILDSFQSTPIERDNLLAILYSPVISLQNDFSISFFDIWIEEIYINEISKVNRFIKNDSSNLEQFSYIKIKLFYTTRTPPKKLDPLW